MLCKYLNRLEEYESMATKYNSQYIQAKNGNIYKNLKKFLVLRGKMHILKFSSELMQVYRTKRSKCLFFLLYLFFPPINLCQDPHIQHHLRIRLYHLIYHLQGGAAPSDLMVSGVSGVFEG